MDNIFKIDGMTCENCVAKIKKELTKSLSDEFTLSLNPPELRIFSSQTQDLKTLNNMISSAGDYRAITLGQVATQKLNSNSKESLYPLFIILFYICGGVLLIAYKQNDFSSVSLMRNFMGGFFIIFSLFKMINLSGFANAFSSYDLIAAQSKIYAYSYPFIELLLGIGYLLEILEKQLNMVTLTIMFVGAVGVYKALKTKKDIQCACLGTMIKLPMTKITLLEDVLMGVMALGMLFT